MPQQNISKPPGGENPDSRNLAVITGATSGIGKAYAEYFASQHYDLLITGRRKEVILPFARDLNARYGIQVEAVIADLSIREDIAKLISSLSRYNNVGALINNAGYGLDCRFSSDDLQHQMAMVKVHVNIPLMLIHKVIPDMIARKSGIIINVSSLSAFVPTAGNAMYTGTKSFLVKFSESLHMDLSHYGIKVQCLCPGFTHTDFHRSHSLLKTINGKHAHMHSGLIPWMKPEEVVKYSINCLSKAQVVCVPGFLNKVIRLLSSSVPKPLYYMVADRITRDVTPRQLYKWSVPSS